MFDKDSISIWESYKSILLLENPKQKISQFKITDPYLKNFIFRYENLVQWKDIKNENDINKYISTILIPKLTKKTKIGEDFDPQNTLFTTNVNWERELNVLKAASENGDVAATTALNSFKNDPESAKRKIISDINNNKNKLFRSWENYILNLNDIYKKNPAFQFIILNSIYSGTDNTRTTGIVPLNQYIVSEIFDKIKNLYDPQKTNKPNPQFNVLDDYKQISIQVAEKNKETIVSGDGKWIKIPSKDNDSKNFESNVELLMNLAAGTNWCIAGETFARSYLNNGDFYIFFRVVNGKNTGVAAIRMDGARISEIRGTENNQNMNDMYIENVLDLVKAERLEGGEAFIKKMKSRKYLSIIKQKIETDTPFTEEDRNHMTDIMSICFGDISKEILKCVKIGNENFVTLIEKSTGRIISYYIIDWMKYFDVEGDMYHLPPVFSEDYNPFKNYDIDYYDPSGTQINYILNEIDDHHMNQIFKLAISEGWEIDESVLNDNIKFYKNKLAFWMAENYDSEISRLIRDGYGRANVMVEYEHVKNSIIKYLDEHFSNFISKLNDMDWFESLYSIALKLPDAIGIYEMMYTDENLDFREAVDSYFNIPSFNMPRNYTEWSEKYAADYIIENLA